jgi:hypothetical protein
MAIPQTREEFKQYCLRKLGAPVIQINLADDQLEDRIDEALSFWNDYHYNGSQLVYIKHQLTADDVTNKYIELPENLLGVVRIFDIGSSISSGTGMFNVTYQFVLNNLQDITGYSIQNYYMSMQHLQFLQEWLVGRPMVRYNKHLNRIYLDISKDRLTEGMWIVVEAYDLIDGTTYSDVWNDRWLQNYATALIKENWGGILTKFTGMQLVGGVQFNGELILNEARTEREKLEEEAKSSLQPLIYNFQG